MTPDLMEHGSRRLQALKTPVAAGATESGGRQAPCAIRSGVMICPVLVALQPTHDGTRQAHNTLR